MFSFYLLSKPGVIRHVLRQVGEQDGQVEPDGLCWIVVRLNKLDIVDLALVVCLGVAAYQEENFLAERNKICAESTRFYLHRVFLRFL